MKRIQKIELLINQTAQHPGGLSKQSVFATDDKTTLVEAADDFSYYVITPLRQGEPRLDKPVAIIPAALVRTALMENPRAAKASK